MTKKGKNLFFCLILTKLYVYTNIILDIIIIKNYSEKKGKTI